MRPCVAIGGGGRDGTMLIVAGKRPRPCNCHLLDDAGRIANRGKIRRRNVTGRAYRGGPSLGRVARRFFAPTTGGSLVWRVRLARFAAEGCGGGASAALLELG